MRCKKPSSYKLLCHFWNSPHIRSMSSPPEQTPQNALGWILFLAWWCQWFNLSQFLLYLWLIWWQYVSKFDTIFDNFCAFSTCELQGGLYYIPGYYIENQGKERQKDVWNSRSFILWTRKSRVWENSKLYIYYFQFSHSAFPM